MTVRLEKLSKRLSKGGDRLRGLLFARVKARHESNKVSWMWSLERDGGVRGKKKRLHIHLWEIVAYLRY